MRCNATSDNTILLAAPIFVSSRVEAQNKWRKLKWLLPNGLSTADTKARVLSRPRETRGCVRACHLAGERQQSLGACYAQAVEDGDSRRLERTRSEMIRPDHIPPTSFSRQKLCSAAPGEERYGQATASETSRTSQHPLVGFPSASEAFLERGLGCAAG
ncbi:hypothetical protein L914_10155 [Phytophthora nicotianae]|uniref:Uncharacterized protein n=1 Tax=Phytophthora nicotianae TaxID=4792 RepID=W2N7X1_PHYNI|nr:hypothetical protein L914_10155 [Phytophthora nicotianae]